MIVIGLIVAIFYLVCMQIAGYFEFGLVMVLSPIITAVIGSIVYRNH